MTPKLLVVLPYCSKDADQARNLIAWISELSPKDKTGPACLLVADALVPREKMVEINTAAKQCFEHVETIAVAMEPEKQVWPFGPNKMFLESSKQVFECYQMPWLWLEPDAVPMRPGWLSELSDAYYECPKRFMGAFIRTAQDGLPKLHMAGCGVYPRDAYFGLLSFCESPHAFDMAMADYVVPRATPTPLIHHHWGEQDLPPTFIADGVPKPSVNSVTLSFVRPEAALFHRCKDDTLISLLRERGFVKFMSAQDEKDVREEMNREQKRAPGRPRKHIPEIPSLAHVVD